MRGYKSEYVVMPEKNLAAYLDLPANQHSQYSSISPSFVQIGQIGCVDENMDFVRSYLSKNEPLTCSTGQRFICTKVTFYKIHTLTSKSK